MTAPRIVLIAGLLMLVLGSRASAQNVTKILDNGQDGEKLVFVVLGDGYAAGDQQQYEADVDKLVLNGVFAHDFYKDNKAAFNIYRVNLVSQESGVSSLTFRRNTALKVIYSGVWNRCWLEETPGETDKLITDAINIKKYDFVLIIANVNKYGGCRRGNRLYITSGDDWNVVAHEYGHGIAGLYDEYSAGKGQYREERINVKNCSVVLDRNNVAWSELVAGNIDLPSDNLVGIDPNDTVGEFTGCTYYDTGVYRPVQDCRMKSNTPHFCPVCLGLMRAAVQPYLAPAAAPAAGGAPGPPQKFTNIVVTITKNNGITVQKATEVTGVLVLSPQGNPAYFAEFPGRGRPNVAALVIDDPFVVRGFVDPENRKLGEKIIPVDSATIVLQVPGTGIDIASRDLGFELYRARPGKFSELTTSALMNFQSVINSASKQDLKRVIKVGPQDLGKQVKAAATQATQ